MLFAASYMGVWIIINLVEIYPKIPPGEYFDDRFSMAIGELFKLRPHAFLLGGFSLIVALQFISMGFLSLQNKRYFEELFHLSTTILKQQKDR